MGTLNGVFTDIGLQNEANSGSPVFVNLTVVSEQIWGQAYDSIQSLRMVSGVYILAMAMAIIIVGALERKHPFLFFVYLLITLLAVIFAPTISNAYESLLNNTNFLDGELLNFTVSNWLILNLPTVVMVIGALGGIFLFINLIRGGGEENIS